MIRHFPVWVLGLLIMLSLLPQIVSFTSKATLGALRAAPELLFNFGEGVVEAGVDVGGFVINIGGDMIEGIGDGLGDLFASDSSSSGVIAPLFTTEIDYWQEDIKRWSDEYDLDPNLMATVMQIESCGHPTVNSSAGAQGLFQVMPMHFASHEVMLDPDTNAMRGAGVLKECLRLADGDAGLAMACYNGGPSVLSKSFDTWLNEPQRYYMWGTGIYADAQNNSATSETLDRWINAGGGTLCDWASAELGLN